MAVGTRYYRSGIRRRLSAPARAGPVLLESKLRPPALYGTPIVRPALQERCNARRVTAVAAPAGFGKSTLLALWARSSGDRAVAWLSLDERDDDPARLLAHAREAITRAHPALRAAVGQPGAGGSTLVALVNAVERAATPLLLLVDDCHAVQSRESRAALSFLARQLPASTLVAFAGREVPALGSGRLRARGELTEVRTDDLRFTTVEAEQLLRERFGVVLAPDDLAELVEHTEGWPAGLYLAGLSLQGHPAPADFVREFAGDHRHVGDFLLEEVLRREAPPVRDFLRRSAILERLSGPLCDATLERSGSGALLADLERRNQFVIPLDDRRESFRYHHLFAEYLRGELVLAEPELLPTLHGRAASWLRTHGELDLAVRHAAAAGQHGEAAAMIVANGPVWAQHGRPATVGTWLDLLPASVLERDAQLAACAAWHARTTGADPATLRERVRLAERPDARPWVGVAATQRAELLLLRAVLPYGDAGATVRAARAASRGIPRSDPAIGLAISLLGLALLQVGRHDEARGPLRAAMRCATRPEQVLLHDGSLALLAAAEAHAGDPERGAHLAERAAHLIDEHDLGPSESIGYAYMGIADAFATAGQPARAIPLARRAADQLALPGPHVTHAYALLVLARALAANGDHVAALATLERLRDATVGAVDVRFVARGAAELAHSLNGRRPSPEEPLSVRELEVLRLLGSDMSQREIAAQLFVSVNTVKTHVRSVLRKFGVGSRGAAVERACEVGLIGGYAPATTVAPDAVIATSTIEEPPTMPPQRLVARMPG